MANSKLAANEDAAYHVQAPNTVMEEQEPVGGISRKKAFCPLRSQT